MPKVVTVVDSNGNAVKKSIIGTNEGYIFTLAALHVQCLVDKDGWNIADYEALTDGATYTMGAQVEPQQPDGKLRCVVLVWIPVPKKCCFEYSCMF